LIGDLPDHVDVVFILVKNPGVNDTTAGSDSLGLAMGLAKIADMIIRQ
jgi:hypothetical protein